MDHTPIPPPRLPRDVVDDLLAADGRHDEVLGVHVVHHHSEAVEEVHEGGHVEERGGSRVLALEAVDDLVRHETVRANLSDEHDEHDVELVAEGQALAAVGARDAGPSSSHQMYTPRKKSLRIHISSLVSKRGGFL